VGIKVIDILFKMNLNDFFKNPIKTFQKIMEMKPEEAEELFKKLNAELEIRLNIEKQKQEKKKEESSQPKEYPLAPDKWI